jgi:RHS repeat-associated protein
MKSIVTMFVLVSFVVNTVLAPVAVQAASTDQTTNARRAQSNPLLDRPGQSMTLLPDGRWLLIGGEGPDGPQARASIWDARSERMTLLGAPLRTRTGHSASVLPNGTVLIFGGVGSDEQLVTEAEVFDPTTQTFTLLSTPNLTPRAYHTATVLTDGQMLIAGGVNKTGETLNSADLWDFRNPLAPSVGGQAPIGIPQSLVTGRRNHTAVLLPTGEVLLWGGIDSTGSEIKNGEWYDPATQTWSTLANARTIVSTEGTGPRVVASIPTTGATDTPLDSLIALRFSTPLQVETVNTQTVFLHQHHDRQPVSVVAAEGGMLAFVLPHAALQPAAAYTLTLDGPQDDAGQSLPVTTIHFTTAQQKSVAPVRVAKTADEPKDKGPTPKGNERDNEDWIPNDSHKRGNWKSGRSDPPEKFLPPLQAAEGMTALAGQVFALSSKPLAGVTLKIGDKQALTDDNGQFLLTDIPTGPQILLIDGRDPSKGNKEYGLYEARVEILAGLTNVLPFTIWLPRINKSKAVKIPSPTTQEVVVTTRDIPGLELRIPPGVTIHDYDGNVVTEVSITAIPLDRTPFPLPAHVEVPVYFTIQPGSAELLNNAEARLIYPNYTDQPAGARFDFWEYEPESIGWGPYGQGTVNANGTQVVPDPEVGIYEFTGAMINSGRTPPSGGPPPGGGCGAEDGNPIDLATGLKIETVTDLTLNDVVPLTLTRTYRPNDSNIRPFGIGTMHNYSIFLWSALQYQEADLIQADGSRIHYVRISPGTGFGDAVFEHTATPTQFYKSRLAWRSTPAGWDLTLKDGTVYQFGENGPPFAVRDRNGNTTVLTWSGTNSYGAPEGNLLQLTSPNGRWIKFTYDASNRITQAKDNANRTVSYTYDASGRLWKVTDAGGGVTEYTYDTSHRVLTKKDPRLNTVYTLVYDANGRVTRQTLADGTVYQFAYTLDANGKVTRVDVTNPRNIVRRVTFNSNGYILTDTHALGLPIQQVTTYTRQAGSNFITSITDALNRRTDFTYDAMGNRTSMIELVGTANAATTTYTYEPLFNQVASITDPLNHTTTFTYDSKGNRLSSTNPLNQQTSYTYNTAGQPLSLISPLNHISQFTYSFGDLATIVDPLGNATTHFTDAVGRVVSTTNPLGQRSNTTYDALDRVTQTINPSNGLTTFTYDANDNLLSLTDARNGVTQYTYDVRNRQATRRDPLLRTESFQYDGMSNQTQKTDRKSQITSTTYDGLNRRTQVTYAGGSTTTYTYDAGNRITQIIDSVGGTITRTYDGMDNLLSETTPQGTVSYTYDHASRRTSMTVAGQPVVNYTYDNADRLTQITQGSSTTTFVYDAAGRRTSLTLPNGVVVTAAYNNASLLTSLTYTKGATTLGDLTYTYDKAGRRIATGGTFARTGLPQAIATATYNANNQQLTLGNKSATYDNNGNLVTLADTGGTTTYTWNSRNQLTNISGPGLTASFQYDGTGRRKQKTVNGTTTNFLYDGLNVVQELNGATPVANLLTSLDIDETLLRTDAAGARSFLTNDLGSTLALTDSAGTVLSEYIYEPFGKTTATGAASTNAFKYTGREDDGTGLYHYRARYYHPGLQRFVAEDPIEFDGGDANLYGCVSNDPVNFFDPTGEGKCKEVCRWVLKRFGKGLKILIFVCEIICNDGGGDRPPPDDRRRDIPRREKPKDDSCM